jgi:hypothetical protein
LERCRWLRFRFANGFDAIEEGIQIQGLPLAACGWARSWRLFLFRLRLLLGRVVAESLEKVELE